jgi:YidC/Oxa1 family membrane protein insertase
MDSKALKNILNQALTFLVIFLIVNFVYNQFFNQPAVPKTGLHFFVDHSQYGQNDLVTAHLENYTDQEITLKNLCPEPAIQVEQLINGEWKPKAANLTINCADQKDIVVKAGEKYPYTFKNWNHQLFGELGSYRLKAQIGDKTLESNQFQVNGASFFSWFYGTLIHQPIYNALVFFISIAPGNDLGLGIILLTILIRTILLIPNHKVLKSQKKMQAIQPKINALKEKHNGDQQKIAAETFAIYKEHKVSPFGSCLPILIQLPILIGLFNVIQTGMDPGSSYLLYAPLQGFDLNRVQPIFLGLLDLTKIDIFVLPILVGLLQYLSLRLSMGKKQQKAVKASSEMEMANRTMTYIMPVMIAFFTASTPAGVGLYWAFSTIYGIAQQLVINKHFQKQETQIEVIGGSKNKEKKKHYQEINEQRKQQGPNDNALEQSNESDSTNDDQDKPSGDSPITVIKV